MLAKRFQHVKWLLRGEYLIGIDECGREIGLIKLYTEPAMAPDKSRYDGQGNTVYFGRVSI